MKRQFNKFKDVPCRAGMSGAQAAMAILHSYGITDVKIEPHGGVLTDHYSPREKTIRLSEPNFNGSSISAIISLILSIALRVSGLFKTGLFRYHTGCHVFQLVVARVHRHLTLILRRGHTIDPDAVAADFFA